MLQLSACNVCYSKQHSEHVGHVQEQKWGNDKGLKKIFGMLKAVKSKSLTFHGWAQTHIVNILWGASSKLIMAMRHDQLCEPLTFQR